MIDTADPSRGLLTKDVDASTFDHVRWSGRRRATTISWRPITGTPPADGTEISISATIDRRSAYRI